MIFFLLGVVFSIRNIVLGGSTTKKISNLLTKKGGTVGTARAVPRGDGILDEAGFC